jgi:hypothetical protein
MRTDMPFMMLPAWMPRLLPQVVYIDLVGLEEQAARDALLAGIRRGRVKPAIPPGFPAMLRRSAPDRTGRASREPFRRSGTSRTTATRTSPAASLRYPGLKRRSARIGKPRL